MVKKNLFSFLVALIIMYLSLTTSETFEKVSFFSFPFFDKIIHFVMYFSLMSVIILENRKTLKSKSQLFLTSLIPLAYGILIEILQSAITVTRFASIYDTISNEAGILVSTILWLLIKPSMNKLSDRN